eukprot:4714052-Pleurochrysis_carterae.AAC.1
MWALPAAQSHWPCRSPSRLAAAPCPHLVRLARRARLCCPWRRGGGGAGAAVPRKNKIVRFCQAPPHSAGDVAKRSAS